MLGLSGGGRQMFYQRQLGPGVQLSKVYLIHQRPDEKDAAAGAAEKVFLSQRIGDFLGIEARALVGDGDLQVLAGIFERNLDLPGGVVLVAVQHRVNGGFAHRHGDMKALVLVETCLNGHLVGG